jgi:hypothetical protein
MSPDAMTPPLGFAIQEPDAAVLQSSPSEFLLKSAAVVLFEILYIVVLTPLAIAVVRHVVLGHVTRRYRLDLSDALFWRFAGLAIVIYLLEVVIATWSMLSFTQTFAYYASNSFALWPLATTWAFVINSFVIFMILLVRTALLFPALALDAPGASWRNSMLDTRGHSWEVFFNLLFAYLPLLLPTIASFYLPATFVIMNSLLATITVCVLAAVASRLYLARANKLGLPA